MGDDRVRRQSGVTSAKGIFSEAIPSYLRYALPTNGSPHSALWTYDSVHQVFFAFVNFP
jgi:hypothetical protein